jgi:hypothetical protein
VQWQNGQHQPDALAALVVAHDVLVHSLGQRVVFASRVDAERRFRERGLATVIPLDRRLTRRISGGGYDPLAFPRTTRRM